MRVAIVGSRHFPEMERVRALVASLPPGTTVVTGGAAGVDAAAADAARAGGLGLQKLPPRLEEATDPSASGARNQRLVEAADMLVAFWDGERQGTRQTVERALALGREVHVYVPGGPGLELS